LIGFVPVRCFFAHSDSSQTPVVGAQHKFQCISHEVFPELISTFGAFVHLDSELPKVPFFIGLLRVRFAIRTFWHH
jgi:hypothetical protein